MKARDVMSGRFVPVGVHDFVDDAVWWLTSHSMTAGPVLDDGGRLVGLVTVSHLRLAWLERQLHPVRAFLVPMWGRRAQTVGEVMHSPVASLTPGAELTQVAALFEDQKTDCVLIVDGMSVVGMITRESLRRRGAQRTE